MQKPDLLERRQLQGSYCAVEFQSHPEVVRGRGVFPVRDVQEQQDRRRGGRERSAGGAAVVRPLQDGEDKGRVPARAVESPQQTRPHSEVLRLLAPAVHRAELPDVQDMQESGVHERAELQRAYLKAELEAHAVDFGGRRVLPVREVPAAVLILRRMEDEGGLFGRSAQ